MALERKPLVIDPQSPGDGDHDPAGAQLGRPPRGGPLQSTRAAVYWGQNLSSNHASKRTKRGSNVIAVRFGVLSEREKQTAILARSGLSNKDIARKLSVTEGTIKAHL